MTSEGAKEGVSIFEKSFALPIFEVERDFGLIVSEPGPTTFEEMIELSKLKSDGVEENFPVCKKSALSGFSGFGGDIKELPGKTRPIWWEEKRAEIGGQGGPE
tara:strand:+ start:226 stop:534 length:309 start_codon:yes stop_codon:yes gene_type:complete